MASSGAIAAERMRRLRAERKAEASGRVTVPELTVTLPPNGQPDGDQLVVTLHVRRSQWAAIATTAYRECEAGHSDTWGTVVTAWLQSSRL